MFKRLKMGIGAAAALAALALGGSAIAGAQQDNQKPSTPNPPAQTQESTAPENSATDRDNIQSTTDPDPAGSSESAESPGSEKAETPGSESAEVPGDDGPGGHADEPANPNANHQYQGVE